MFFKCVQFSWCFLLLLIEISADDKKAYKIVETENGSIRGIRMNTLLQKRDYFSFRGIRYAEPPVGELRFKVNLICLSKTFSFFSILLFYINRHQDLSQDRSQQSSMRLNMAVLAYIRKHYYISR